VTSKPKKVLIIGSGPIVIGQAAEFDYSGSQACRSLREEGVHTVLVNSNPATIMTDEGIADTIYIEPLTVPVIERIIAREKPDGLLPTLGGQTGLNLAVALADAGVLDKYDLRSLGTPIETIRTAEDRDLFCKLLEKIGEPVPESATVTTMEQAREAAKEIGLPLVVRPAYTLGGTGGGIVQTRDELELIVRGGLAASPIDQVLLERYLRGWKEIEYEVMRDGANNCITVCNMENIDPMGVHTGDSIVVAPSQTLPDKEYQMLRSASLKIIRALGIEGGCNIQFALAPRREIADWEPSADGLPPYYVIEVNPRVSRSSALASKATGYPIARVAAKIAIGDTALAVRQVPAGRAPHRHADEGDGRGDGDRPHVRGGAGQGRALAGVRRALAAVGEPGLARHRPPRLRGDPDGRTAVGRAGVAAARRDGRRAVGPVGDRPLVPDEDGEYRRG